MEQNPSPAPVLTPVIAEPPQVQAAAAVVSVSNEQSGNDPGSRLPAISAVTINGSAQTASRGESGAVSAPLTSAAQSGTTHETNAQSMKAGEVTAPPDPKNGQADNKTDSQEVNENTVVITRLAAFITAGGASCEGVGG